jgi:4-aminobutyrate aminotransferase-like enzyme
MIENIAAKYASYVETACNEIVAEGNSLSAFIIEGGMSVAGVILPPKSYLKRCADAVRKAGGLYIADEVQTGFGKQLVLCFSFNNAVVQFVFDRLWMACHD